MTVSWPGVSLSNLVLQATPVTLSPCHLVSWLGVSLSKLFLQAAPLFKVTMLLLLALMFVSSQIIGILSISIYHTAFPLILLRNKTSTCSISYPILLLLQLSRFSLINTNGIAFTLFCLCFPIYCVGKENCF